LNELLQKMQDTVTEAEPSEPLLAEKLYETFRETKQRDIENQLDLVPRLVERGLAAPVQQTLDEIETGLRELRVGVEQAAESVLGSEVDGLRRALGELEELQRKLQEEFVSRNPSTSERKQSENTASTDSGIEENKSPQEPTENADAESQAKPSSEAGKSEKSQGKSEKAGDEGGKQSLQKSSQKGTPSENPSGSPQQGSAGSSEGIRSTNENGNSSGRASLADVLERNTAPITGNSFGEWSDGLRDVEESVRDPELRGIAAGIRQSARELHRDYVRHSKEPQWDLVRELVAKPLAQLRETVQAELLRKSADRNAVVPIDRDPVPTVFEQRLLRYYENLGSQKAKKP